MFRLLIKPTLFTAGVCGTCFCGSAISYYENRTVFTRGKYMDTQIDRVLIWLEAAKQDVQSKRKNLEFRQKVNKFVNDLPTSAKIAGTAIFINALVLCGWRFRNCQPVMQKYFLSRISDSKIPLSPLILSCFSHSSPVHFAVNMFALYSFSDAATHMLGPEQLVGMYISAGAVSSLASIAYRLSTRSVVNSLGASGALLGVIAYICVKSPDAKLLLFFVPILAGNAIKGMICLDIVGMIAKWGYLDHAAHLGGSLFGVWYAIYGEQLYRQHRQAIFEHWLELKRKFE